MRVNDGISQYHISHLSHFVWWFHFFLLSLQKIWMIMIPNLPRPLLWTEKSSLEEFIEDDPINVWFQGCYSELPYSLTSRVGELKFFNEVYYQLTRICYEHPQPEDLSRYAASIEEDLGWVFSVDLVMSMMYFYARYRGLLHSDPINHFFRCVWRRYSNSEFWGSFSQSRKVPDIYGHHRMEISWDREPSTLYPLNPCPILPEELIEAKFDWSALTQDYHPDVVNEVINLWNKDDDKQVVRIKICPEEDGGGQLLLGKLLQERARTRELEAQVEELEQEKMKLEELLERAKESVNEGQEKPLWSALGLYKNLVSGYVNSNEWKRILLPYRAAIEIKALPLWSHDEFVRMTMIKVPKASYSKCVKALDAYKPEELEFYKEKFSDLPDF